MYVRAQHEVIAIGTVRSPWRLVRSLGPTLQEKRRSGISIKYAVYLTPENAEDVRVISGYADVRTIDFPMPGDSDSTLALGIPASGGRFP
jgi:hypothetical protein